MILAVGNRIYAITVLFIQLTTLGAYNINFWTLRVGTNSRWALIRGWVLIKFSPFSTSLVCLFCNKAINGNNKTQRSNKAWFLQNTLTKKLRIRENIFLSLIWVWVGGVGHLFEVGANSRLGVYSNKIIWYVSSLIKKEA